MKEVRFDGIGVETSARCQEDYTNNIIANVSFPLKLVVKENKIAYSCPFRDTCEDM